MKTVLVTGATGAVGPRVVDALRTAGYRVRVLALDAPKQGTWTPEVDFRTGDITREADIRGAMEGCQGCIHLAALLHVVNPSPELRAKYEAINVGGTKLVVAAALAAGVERVVFFSTIAVYGYAHSSGTITEETPPHPDSAYGESKLDAEKIVLDARRADGNPLGSVLRMGAIYGSGIKGNYRTLARSLARGRFVPVGAGNNRRTLVYDRDAAAAALVALEQEVAAGRVYNVTDGAWHTVREIVAAVCAALGRHPPRLGMPLFLARPATAVADRLLTLARGRSPGLRAALDKYVEEVCVSGERAKLELGFAARYDLERGWRECVAEMRAAGEL